jgi:hypothetical protein
VGIEAGDGPGETRARLVHGQQLGQDAAHGVDPRIGAGERGRRHRVLQDAGRDRVPLGVVAVQQALRRGPRHHLGQLPTEVDRILHADVEALPAHRVMHVRGIPREEHRPFL